MLNAIPFVYFFYAVALFGGGYMGYKTAGSVPSLIGSSLFAVLAIAAGIISLQNKHNGLLLGLETAMLVIGLFVFRYIQTGKPMPAFGAIGMSVIVAIVTVMAVSQLPKGNASTLTPAEQVR
ncbi:MAG: TMEM14 family protein [Akkermansiaceae bacterium]|nr:TMEM14 family protein [Armatimonadota bacterium]